MLRKYKVGKRFIIIFLVFAVILPLYSFDKYVNKNLEEQLIMSLKDISDQNVNLIQNEINKNFKILENISAKFDQYTEEELANKHESTKDIAERFGFREVGIALPNGIAYMSSNTIFDVSEREYFKRSMNGENYVSEILEDMEDQTEINVYSVPITNSKKEVVAVFFAVYDTSNFAELLQIDSFDGEGYSYIVNSKADILNVPEEGLIGGVNLFDILRNSATSSEYKKLNSEAINEIKSTFNSDNKQGYSKYWYDTYKYAVYKKLDVNDWWLMTLVPQETLTKRIQPITLSTHFMFTFIVFLSVVAALYTINKDNKLKSHLEKVAYRDTSLDVYNKNYLKEKISNTKYLKKPGYKSALVLFNIRNFKMINNIHGVKAGDYLIKKIGKILKENEDFKEDIVAHSNGDEFLALYFYKNKEDLEKKLNKIENKIRKVNYEENNIFIKLYVGIYEINSLENDFEKIYNYANIAKNKSKDLESNFFTYYNEELAEAETNERKLEDEIKEAIERKEFKAWFQPKFDCETKEIVGCEALVRWYRQDGKVYFPNTFIELSEKNGLIKEIDKLVLEDVCINLNKWRKLGFKCMPVSVNISRIYLDNMDIIADLNEIIARHNISPEYIQLEITESSLVKNEKVLSKIINEMHKYGFKVLLDDFGVGYSSLHSINELNFDTLKIDKSFVDSIGINNGDHVLKHTINLGKILDMEVVAEGVETKEQYNFLKENGCDTIQGYYFSKPLDNKSFEELLKNINFK